MKDDGHKPDRWQVVDAGPFTVVLSATCECGDDHCVWYMVPSVKDAEREVAS